MGCPTTKVISRPAWPGVTEATPGFHYHHKTGEARVQMAVPCGSCPSCMAAVSMQWAIRCHHESTLHKQNSFLTLTYDPEHLPTDGTLQPGHLSLFWKRLRHLAPRIRYFACGEYGENTRRPHYHALIFGADFLGGSKPLDAQLYEHPDITACWGKGTVAIAEVNMSTCCYVAGYATKKIGDPDTFIRMSRKPGIGHGWIDKYEDDVRRTGTVVIEGREYPLPKRYFDWNDFSDLKEYRKAESERKSALKTPTEHIAARRSRVANAKERLNRRSGKI